MTEKTGYTTLQTSNISDDPKGENKAQHIIIVDDISNEVENHIIGDYEEDDEYDYGFSGERNRPGTFVTICAVIILIFAIIELLQGMVEFCVMFSWLLVLSWNK